MKSPHTFPNRSLSRRLLSTFLSLAMVLSLLPVWTLPAMADGGAAVTYDRKTPKVSILNAYSGRSEKLYSAIKGDGAYAAYNGIGLYKRQRDGQPAKYSDRATGNEQAWDFSLSTTPVLKELAQVSNNLQFNTSATFYNRTHTHSHYNWKEVKTYTAEMTVTEKVYATFSGSARVIDGWSDKSRTYPRIGDLGGVQSNRSDGFNTIYYKEGNDHCSLQFSHRTFAWKDFEPRTCTCGGSYAENFVVAFRDERAPVCTGASYSVNGGSWVKSTKGVRVGAGQSVRIKLSFNEPIRFADDSANHGDLKLILQPDGTSADTSPAAGLVELSGNDLIFQYTVPQGQDLEINTLNTSRLFGENLPLKQVGPSGSFSIAEDIKVNGSTLGLSTTTCYITDLAGNPLQKQTILDANLTLDSGAPYVAKVAFELTCNNTDVKEALGKAGKGPGTAGYDETSYTDKSDTHLGVGDSFYLIVSMNERLQGIGMDKNAAGRYSIDWQHAVFTTNLRDKNGNPVEIRSAYYYSFYDYDREPTQFITNRITIGEGWTLDGNQIEVIAMRFEKKEGTGGTLGTVTDLAGNALKMDNVTISSSANGNPPYLDAAAPTVAELENSYAKEGAGFRYGFTLSDSGSGYEGIYGSFILNNNGDKKAYPYEWAVKADPAQVADGEWQNGITGTAQTFMQTPNVYFHIRPKADATYVDLSGCTITVRAKDFAGNESNVTLPAGGLAWYIDNLAPTAAAGSTTRVLNSSGSGGTLTAEVILSDGRGISEWQYAWSDSGDTAPASWSNGTVTATSTGGVTVYAPAQVGDGELFSQYLWVKATDNSTGTNTSAPICLGQYSYDLRAAQYELKYSSSITCRPSIVVKSVDQADSVVFLVPASDASDNNKYAVLRYDKDSRYASNLNIFESTQTWGYYTVTKDENGIYTFVEDESKAAESRIGRLWTQSSNAFVGDLTVKVLSGKHSAVVKDETGALTTLGNGTNLFEEDTIALRLSGYASLNDLFDSVSLTCNDNLGKRSVISYWTTSEGYTQRTTLAGLRFTVSIAGDNRGWKYENLDWKKSYILLKSEEGHSYKVPINPFQINAADPNGPVTQTVTVPEGDYNSGVYYASFVLKTVSVERGFETALGTQSDIVVDTRQPNSNFSLSSILYAPQLRRYSEAYGLGQSYGDGGLLECVPSDGGVIYLPISQGTYIGAMPEYYITVTSPDEEDMERHKTAWTGSGDAYTGRYCVQLWNAANATNKIEIVPYSAYDKVQTDATTQDANVDTPNYGVGFTFDAGKQDNKSLYIKSGEINTVAVQKVYENGRRSDIKYYQIMPVDDAVTGKVTIDTDTKQLVFTPEAGVSTAGATVFAWAWQNGEDAIGGKGKRVEMSAYADGTWRCALQEGGANYEVITVSAHGALCEVGYLGQRTPWFDDAPSANGSYKDNGVSGIQFQDNNNGTYTLMFRVRDDQDTMKDGLTVDVGFNEEYSKNTFTLTYDGTDVTWTTNDGHPTGIYSVTAVRGVYGDYFTEAHTAMYKRDYLDVTVEGVFAKVGGTMDITVTATDALGNTGSVSSAGNPVNYVEPKVTGRHSILAMTFNQPVRPVESWAWHEKDGEGFKTDWTRAFPISGKGTWSIQYRDAFGQIHAEEVRIDDFTQYGKDYSLALSFSTTDITAEAVTMTTNAANGTVKVYEINGTTRTEMTPVDGFPGIGTQKRQTHINENMETEVELNDGGNIYRLRVYIDNIVNGAPTAQVHYYVQALGQEFTQSELDAYAANGVTVTGNVRAWYSAARHVTPTGGTGSDFLFTPGGTASHAFTYADDLGNTGSVTAALPDGLTLKAPARPPEDTTRPDVDVDIYVKRAGSYTPADAFLGTDSKAVIDDKFDALGYVQGYSLTVKATDESGIERITVAGDGAAITGNVITITKAGTYTVTVTDKSPNANKTEFTINVPDKIDNTPPTVAVTAVPTSLYSKNLYVTVADNSGAAALAFPAGLDIVFDTTTDKYDQPHIGAYKYVAADNKTVQFTAIDEAGNTGSTSATVSGIDTEPPELTVRWSPSDEKDSVFQPTGPLNTNVTAHIDSSKAMQYLTVRAGNETDEHPLLTKDTAMSHTISGQNGDLVTITATPERVTVTFKENYDQTLTFTASAANGKSTAVTLNGITVIDKVAPTVTHQEVTRYDRAGKKVGNTDAAYQVVVAITPSKPVTSANYGATKVEDEQLTPVIYGPSAPLKITFTRNGTYNVRFTDKAGNTATVPVTITGIDRTAPTLTVAQDTANDASVTITVNEACKVTADGTDYTMTANTPQTVTFTQNGTFAITATDNAGNESFKTVRVGSIDNDPPSISFDNSTIYVTEGTTADALKAELDKGYTVWDNVTAKNDLTVSYDSSAVDLTKANQYVVTYTVTDAAGNKTTANRFVRVIGANTVCVNIDGKLILPDSTAVLRPGAHTLTLQNSDQPYSIKARRGILSAGQMKYLSGSSLHFDADGKFAVSSTGYYTLLVTTQDRQTIRVLLYVEQ